MLVECLARSNGNWQRWLIGITLPGLAVGLIWWTRPFPVILNQYSTTLQGRTAAQRHNIQLAAHALDGIIIQPHQDLSFNQIVGPRTIARGYQSAPAFMTATTLESVGGGICQVSSTLYSAALATGLDVIERHAHYTVVASVPPGQDATVWYGQADLRLHNPYPWPIQIDTHLLNDRLTLQIRGSRSISPLALQLKQTQLDHHHLQVSVYREDQLISQDTYLFPPSDSPDLVNSYPRGSGSH